MDNSIIPGPGAPSLLETVSVKRGLSVCPDLKKEQKTSGLYIMCVNYIVLEIIMPAMSQY